MSFSPNARGIVAMNAAMLLFTANDACVKLAAAEASIPQIMLLRGFFVIAFLLVAAAASGQLRAWRSLAEPAVLVRSLLEAAVVIVFLTALARMGLAEVTALFLTAPLLMTAASAFLLREPVGWRRWAAVTAGFLGMLMIVRPTPAGVDWYALLALLAAVGAVARDLSTLRIAPGTPSIIVSLAAGASVTLLGAALTPASGWVAPSPGLWLLLFAAAVFVSGGNYAIVVAFRAGEVSAVAPFRYLILFWALLAGVAIWGDVPDGTALAGATVIVASGVYVAHRERIRSREARSRTAGLTKP
jgi:drug/metabolite transporter (DMT)-like permease